MTTAQHVDHEQEVLKSCPKGAKLLSHKLWKWGQFRAEQFAGECIFVGIDKNAVCDDNTVECHHVGIPHDPLEFLEKAATVGHPKDLARHVNPTLHEVILDNFHRPPYVLAKKRVDFIKKYTQLAKETKSDELKLRLKMPAHIRKILAGKRIHLLGMILSDLQFPDEDLTYTRCLNWIQAQRMDARFQDFSSKG